MSMPAISATTAGAPEPTREAVPPISRAASRTRTRLGATMLWPPGEIAWK
jgi:hypothetical protein